MSSKRRIGRPVGQTDNRETILNIAEELFAKHGFSAASLREVAEKAGVNQALISYYFKSKRGLYEEVFKRRANWVVEQRGLKLDALLVRTGGKPTAREIVQAYLEPQFEIREMGKAGSSFLQIQARLHIESDESAFQLRREVFDAVSKRYIDALKAALPDIDPVDVTWRMTFLIGVYLFMLGGADRLEDLSSGSHDTQNTQEVVDRLTSFIEGGLHAPSTY